jgi:hypothetical protein
MYLKFANFLVTIVLRKVYIHLNPTIVEKRDMMRKSVLLFILFCLSILSIVQFADAATTTYNATFNLTANSADSYTVPSDIFTDVYGDWDHTKAKDGNCTSTKCWSTGMLDVYYISGNELFQSFNFSSIGFNGAGIRNLTLCLDACWNGGTTGCNTNDYPEFNTTTNGTAQIQIYNGTAWETLGSAINLGNNDDSDAVNLTEYCVSKNGNFTNNYTTNNVLQVRVYVSGDSIDYWADVYMITDYIGMQVNATITKTSGGGGGGGGGCSPRWVCGDWGRCDLAGIKYRECNDLNGCNVIDGVPELSTRCNANELCYNGLKDSTEKDIDCGGVCRECPKQTGGDTSNQVTQTTVPQKPGILSNILKCQPFSDWFWFLYLTIILLSYILVYAYNGVTPKNRKDYLLQIMIVSNILLFALVLIDFLCFFRWHLIVLLAIIFATITYLDKVMSFAKKKRII